VNRDNKGPLSIPLLSDPKHQVIDAYGLEDPRYLKQNRAGIPWPATYVIDRTGRVAWVRIDRDYTARPLNSDIRAALDRLQ
jgi:peroxiredoxin